MFTHVELFEVQHFVAGGDIPDLHGLSIGVGVAVAFGGAAARGQAGAVGAPCDRGHFADVLERERLGRRHDRQLVRAAQQLAPDVDRGEGRRQQEPDDGRDHGHPEGRVVAGGRGEHRPPAPAVLRLRLQRRGDRRGQPGRRARAGPPGEHRFEDRIGEDRLIGSSELGLQGPLERLARGVKPRLDGADGDVERRRDLGQRPALEVVEDEDRPLRGRTGARTRARACRAQAVCSSGAGSGAGTAVERVAEVAGGDLPDGTPAASSQDLPAAVDEDPPEPGVEAGRVTEAGPPAPGVEERLLGRVPRVGLVAEDRPRGPVGAVDAPLDELLERRPVTGLGALHEERRDRW